jgi:hypothetical protein
MLLIVPHLLALAGLLAYAYRAMVTEPSGDDYGGRDGDQGDQTPREPESGPPLTGPPLPNASSPPRRLHVGERLSELHPRRLRREHDPEQPTRPRVKT